MAPSHPRHARVYLHRGGSRLIIATVQYTQDGFALEAPGPLSLTKWDDEDLAGSLRTALEQSGTVTRTFDPADRPSLQVSGEPSDRAFQSTFVELNVHEVEGPGQLFYRIDALPDTQWQLVLRTSVSSEAPASEIAHRIMQLFETCRDRRF
ncbi:MAG: hypothetical protein EHM91_10195 [Planctomycetota bacterium]|nr:MAG: hypothetical protein EHM91_10195 [Planctomycetota bacterium]